MRRTTGLIGAALVAALFASGMAASQQRGELSVLIVDMKRIRADTLAGKAIDREKALMRQRIQKEVSIREALIRDEEETLALARDSLDAEEFRERVKQFEGRVSELRQFAQEQSSLLQRASTDAAARLRLVASRELAAIVSELGAELLLDKSQIVLGVDRLEITDQAIARINARLPKVTLSVDYGPTTGAALDPSPANDQKSGQN